MRGFELLERARDARAVLLTVLRVPPSSGADAEERGAAFVLVFDAGRVLVAPSDPGARDLCAFPLESDDDVPADARSAAEEEPWWRVLGAPLAGAWSEEGGAVLRLQLRDDADAPRFASLRREGAGVRAAIARAPR
ncbi:MAG: hypothetical protein R3E88_01360 [Myxococcota bacterium]